MRPKDTLRALGLEEKEVLTYLALLQLGTTSAQAVALKSGLKRPTTYFILNELVQKGFVLKIPRARKQLFVAVHPEEVYAIAHERLLQVKRQMPELIALTRGSDKVSTIYFEGVQGIKQLLEYKKEDMAGCELVGFYATDTGVDKKLTDYFKDEWAPLMKSIDVHMRWIVPRDTALDEYREDDAMYNRTVKSIPSSEYSSETAIDTIGDIVRIHDYKNLQGVAIESADVAKTVREIFEMLWKRL